MKRLTDEDLEALHAQALSRRWAGWAAGESVAASNLIIIELLQRQMEGKK